MLKNAMRTWRSHPILASAGLGAICGAVDALILEIGGLSHRHATGVLPLLSPSSASGARVGQMTAVQVAFLLVVEIAGSVAGFAVLFAAPVALVVGIRRIFGHSKGEPLPESKDS
jgi:hypothetical protein